MRLLNKLLLPLTLSCLTLIAPSALAQAQDAKAAPTLWLGPPASDNGRALRELFEHPEQWQATRRMVDVLFSTDLHLQHQYSDAELGTWLPKLKQWHIKLALEVGAIKEWGPTGEKTFNAERPMWERIQRLGGNIYAIALDEPLVCVRSSLKKPDDYAVQETANYIALVRQHYPQMLIGDIETYPSISVADHKWWLAALQKRLAALNTRGLDFYRLDVDWVAFNIAQRGSWQEVKQIEDYCHQQHFPFSLIYWASDYPALQKRGLADDSTWYVSMMQQGYDYALIGGEIGRAHV